MVHGECDFFFFQTLIIIIRLYRNTELSKFFILEIEVFVGERHLFRIYGEKNSTDGDFVWK